MVSVQGSVFTVQLSPVPSKPAGLRGEHRELNPNLPQGRGWRKRRGRGRGRGRDHSFQGLLMWEVPSGYQMGSSRERAGNTNSKQDNQIKWAFKNSSFSQTFQNRPSLIWVIFWVQIISSPILQIRKYRKLAGKVYYLGIYLKRRVSVWTESVYPLSVPGRQTCWFVNSPVTPLSPPDSLETPDSSALGAASFTLLVFVSFKWTFLGGYSLHVPPTTCSFHGSIYSETNLLLLTKACNIEQ